MHYREDLAWIHHAGFSDFAERASDGVLELLWKHRVREGHVVEIGCGSGVLARDLTLARFTVSGYDASPAMIDLARATAPEARFTVANFEELELPACDAIVAMGEVLNHGDIRRFLPRAAQALREGGLLLFDVAERDSYPAQEERRVDGDDWAVIILKESDGTRVTRTVRTFRMMDDAMRRDEEVHTLELYDRDELLALLEPEFEVKVRRSYGTARLPKGHAVYVATRRGSQAGSNV